MLLIKIGGGKTINWDYVVQDLISLVKKEEVILVHGASNKRDEIAQELGSPTKYLTAPSGNQGVYTDQQALDILCMAYAGLVNKQLVAKLQAAGIKAIGLSGADGRIWEGKRKKYLLTKENDKEKLVTDTFTGKVTKVNHRLLKLLTKEGYVPVLTQPAISNQGGLINTDNDRNIAVMAKALKVEKLVVLFEASGLLRDPEDETSLINQINKNELGQCFKYAQGRMRKKLLGAQEAISLGVNKIFWGDGRVKQPVISALAGKGTTIC